MKKVMSVQKLLKYKNESHNRTIKHDVKMRTSKRQIDNYYIIWYMSLAGQDGSETDQDVLGVGDGLSTSELFKLSTSWQFHENCINAVP